ncbi:MAG: tetratricopeptide repeat protein [Candidatus Margulisiibacteriota bacterium]
MKQVWVAVLMVMGLSTSVLASGFYLPSGGMMMPKAALFSTDHFTLRPTLSLTNDQVDNLDLTVLYPVTSQLMLSATWYTTTTFMTSIHATVFQLDPNAGNLALGAGLLNLSSDDHFRIPNVSTTPGDNCSGYVVASVDFLGGRWHAGLGSRGFANDMPNSSMGYFAGFDMGGKDKPRFSLECVRGQVNASITLDFGSTLVGLSNLVSWKRSELVLAPCFEFPLGGNGAGSKSALTGLKQISLDWGEFSMATPRPSEIQAEPSYYDLSMLYMQTLSPESVQAMAVSAEADRQVYQIYCDSLQNYLDGDTDGAMAKIKQALAQRPNCQLFYARAGLYAYMAGRKKEAQAAWEKALTCPPADVLLFRLPTVQRNQMQFLLQQLKAGQ